MKQLLATFTILAMLSEPARAIDMDTLDALNAQAKMSDYNFEHIKALDLMIKQLQAEVRQLQNLCMAARANSSTAGLECFPDYRTTAKIR